MSLPAAVNDTPAGSNDSAKSAKAQPKAEVARTALDAASGTEVVNLFGATGSQRGLEASEVQDVQDAINAFAEAGYQVGFVVYDFTRERGLASNADVTCFSASTIKAPFVAYTMQSVVDAGHASLSDQVQEDVVVEGTGIMAFDDESVYSDNTGYALLREGYGESFEPWAAAAGVDASEWEGEWYPYYTPRDLAKLWLSVGGYLRSGSGNAAACENLLAGTDTSFLRKALGADHRVLAKAGYEIDTPWFDMGALNDAGIVQSEKGDYLVAIMSDADYDDEYFTDTEPLIVNLIKALNAAHDRLLAA